MSLASLPPPPFYALSLASLPPPPFYALMRECALALDFPPLQHDAFELQTDFCRLATLRADFGSRTMGQLPLILAHIVARESHRLYQVTEALRLATRASIKGPDDPALSPCSAALRELDVVAELLKATAAEGPSGPGVRVR